LGSFGAAARGRSAPASSGFSRHPDRGGGREGARPRVRTRTRAGHAHATRPTGPAAPTPTRSHRLHHVRAGRVCDPLLPHSDKHPSSVEKRVANPPLPMSIVRGLRRDGPAGPATDPLQQRNTTPSLCVSTVTILASRPCVHVPTKLPRRAI